MTNIKTYILDFIFTYNFDIKIFNYILYNESNLYDFFIVNFSFGMIGIKLFSLVIIIKILIIIFINLLMDKTVNFYNLVYKNLGFIFIETLIIKIQEMVKENFGGHYPFKNYLFNLFPLFFSVFFLILISNFLGLIPFGYSITSLLAVNFVLSFSFLVGLTFMALQFKVGGILLFLFHQMFHRH